MGDCKRSARKIATMEASTETTMSKKRKTMVASSDLQLRSSNVDLGNAYLLQGCHETAVSPSSSVNSDGTVVSGEFCSGRFLYSCCSSNENSEVVKDSTRPLDLEAKNFETVNSTGSNIKVFSGDMFSRDCRNSFSEFSGDSEEMSFQAKSSKALAKEQRKFPVTKVPPKAEIEEFFAMAEKYEQKRFAEKYNYDIVKDMPVEGRYHWVRLN